MERAGARRDVFTVIDFGGTAISQLGVESSVFAIFVFGRDGTLLKQWDDVPTAAELGTILKRPDG